WGPEPIRLGFIGAPIATLTSYYLISIASFVYGRYFIAQTAWHPLSRKMFSDLGVLAGLGLSSIFFSSAQVATIRVGNLLGEKNAIRARVASEAGLAGVFLATIITRQDFPSYFFLSSNRGHPSSSLILYLARNSWPKLYTDDPGIPLGMWLAFRWGVGLAGLWIGLTVGLAINSLCLIFIWSRTDWNDEVAKVMERNSREERRRQAALMLGDADV
ncbi:hypothetical protein H0H93_015377, partial [Arthromyces matolae]